MYAKILILLVLAILCTGCTDPDLPDPHEFENITPGAPALQKSWDSETQTITISTLDDTPRLTIRKVSAVPDLCTFEEVLEIKSFVDYDLNKLKDFRTRWKKHKGQHDISKVEWFILKNESYDVSIPDYDIVEHSQIIPQIISYAPTTSFPCNCTIGDDDSIKKWDITRNTANGTENGTICFDRYEVLQKSPLKIKIYWNVTEQTGSHNEVQYHDIWKSFSPIGKSIHAGQTYTVKIVYHKPAEVGNVRIQTIPMFAGVECGELTWWNTSWNYRRNVTTNHSQIDAVMTNFPTMVAITQLGLNTDGNDTRITDSSDNQVAREIECYNETSGDLVFFFNGASVSSTVDTSFWIYYNNSAASEPAADSTYGSEAVWDNNYAAVYHFNYEPNGAGANTLLDSTSNGITLSPNGFTVDSMIDGDYGKGIDFDGTDDYFRRAAVTISNSYWNILSHHKTGSDASLQSILSSTWSSAYYVTCHLCVYNSHYAYYTNAWQYAPTTLAANTEYIASFNRPDTSNVYYYLDGVADGYNGASTSYDNFDLVGIGTHVAPSPTWLWTGNMYELRLSNCARTSNYITTTHNNLNNPTATGTDPFFASFGAEESERTITEHTPATPLRKTVGDSQLFTVNTYGNSQCRWYINGSLMQTNSTGATRHEYTNSSLDEGYWNFTAIANTTDQTSSQTWWVTVSTAGTVGQDMYIDRWMYVTYLNGSNTDLSGFFTDLAPYYLSFYNATDQKTYNYKSGRWEKYADKIIKPGEAAMLRYTSNVTKTRDTAGGTFGFTMKTGLNHIGHSYNGTRNLAWYNTTIASANLVTIAHQNPETGALSTFTYGSADNGSVDVLQGCGVEVNVSADTVISGL